MLPVIFWFFFSAFGSHRPMECSRYSHHVHVATKSGVVADVCACARSIHHCFTPLGMRTRCIRAVEYWERRVDRRRGANAKARATLVEYFIDYCLPRENSTVRSADVVSWKRRNIRVAKTHIHAVVVSNVENFRIPHGRPPPPPGFGTINGRLSYPSNLNANRLILVITKYRRCAGVGSP